MSRRRRSARLKEKRESAAVRHEENDFDEQRISSSSNEEEEDSDCCGRQEQTAREKREQKKKSKSPGSALKRLGKASAPRRPETDGRNFIFEQNSYRRDRPDTGMYSSDSDEEFIDDREEEEISADSQRSDGESSQPCNESLEDEKAGEGSETESAFLPESRQNSSQTLDDIPLLSESAKKKQAARRIESDEEEEEDIEENEEDAIEILIRRPREKRILSTDEESVGENCRDDGVETVTPKRSSRVKARCMRKEEEQNRFSELLQKRETKLSTEGGSKDLTELPGKQGTSHYVPADDDDSDESSNESGNEELTDVPNMEDFVGNNWRDVEKPTEVTVSEFVRGDWCPTKVLCVCGRITEDTSTDVSGSSIRISGSDGSMVDVLFNLSKDRSVLEYSENLVVGGVVRVCGCKMPGGTMDCWSYWVPSQDVRQNHFNLSLYEQSLLLQR